MKNILKISFHEYTNVLICKVWKKIGLSWICENTIFLVTSHRNKWVKSEKNEKIVYSSQNISTAPMTWFYR